LEGKEIGLTSLVSHKAWDKLLVEYLSLWQYLDLRTMGLKGRKIV
jgi:hypothetical protein